MAETRAVVAREAGTIDAQRFAAEGRRWIGSVSVGGLDRLMASGVRPVGELAVELEGGASDGEPWLRVVVNGELEMLCQRCLEALRVPVAVDSRLTVREAVVEPDGEPEWTVEDIGDDVVVDGPLDVAVLVEDEVLLQLPMVALHRACEQAGSDSVGQMGSSPFAALAAWRRFN